MAGLSDAHLQGKLLRGGMGTGMPEFGSLYTVEEQWAMIAFVQGLGSSKKQVTPERNLI